MASVNATVKVEFAPKSKQIYKDLKHLSNLVDQMEKDTPWQTEFFVQMREGLLRIVKNLKAK